MSGLIIQWGHETAEDVTLPIAYSTSTSFSLVSQLNRMYVGGHYDTEVYHPTSRNTIHKDNASVDVHWIAIGY